MSHVKKRSLLGRAALSLLMAGILYGCTADHLVREGQTMVDEGRYEEGLQKLQDAAKADPNNVTYRVALKREREQVVNRLLAAATEARASGQEEAAKSDYQRILAVEPGNRRAASGLDSLAMDSRHAKAIAEAKSQLKNGNTDAASAALKPVLLEDPNSGEALSVQRQIGEQVAREQNAEPALKAQFKKPVTLQFRDANIKMVFEALSGVSGINVMLDKDVKPDIKVSIFVKDVSVEDAIDLILLQSQLEKKIISDNTVFVYPNTPTKLRDYQDLVIRSFHLTNADPKQMMAMLKTVLKTKDIFLNEKINAIVVRDTPEAIRLAEKMIADQDIAEPEVMMEVEVLEVNRTRLTDIGIKWPDQLGLTAIGTGVLPNAATTTATASTLTSPTLNELKHINSNNIVTSPNVSVALKAMLQDSDTNILASPRIRARNREKAKIMIGDRVPVITNAVTPVSTGTPVVTGNVQYLDVGLKLEVEPDIRLNNDVAIKINLDVSSIVKEVQNTSSGTLAYQIGTRNASTLLQLKDGETQILAGLIDNEQRNSANKVPGLGQLPILGHLFSEHNDNGTKTEVILSITPHVVGKMRQPDAGDVEYWSGTEGELHSRPVLMKRVRGTPNNAAAATVPAVPSMAGQQAGGTASVLTDSPAATGTAPTGPLAFSWQGPTLAKVGDKFGLTLSSQAMQGMKSLGFLVGFDPQVLKAVDVVEGDALKQGSAQSSLSKVIDQASGQIMVDLKGAELSGATGSGGIITIVFEVTRASPQSQITTGQLLALGTDGKPLDFKTPGPYLMAIQ